MEFPKSSSSNSYSSLKEDSKANATYITTPEVLIL